MVQSSQDGHGISEKEGPEATASLSFPNIHLWACNLSCQSPWAPLSISLGKAHVTKMKLNLNIFPLGLQIPQISYCIFQKPVIYTNFITCSDKLSLHAAERSQ